MVIILGIVLTLIVSKLLSKTILKGVPSSFILELPPYRRPQIGKIIVRSIFDRTLFVLGRSLTVAIPAGLVIWLFANIGINGNSLLSIIANLVNQIFKDEEATLAVFRSMTLAISQMYQRKLSVLHIYENNLQSLYQACKNTNSTLKASLQQELDLLNDYLRPLKEYISYKDYKDQDRLLIKTIPFSLTHSKECTLIKLMAPKSTDSLYTSCQLETSRTIFVDLIYTHNDFLQFENQELQSEH